MAGIFDKKNKKIKGFLQAVAKSAGAKKEESKPSVKLEMNGDEKKLERFKKVRNGKKLDKSRIKGIFESFRKR